MCPVLVRRNGEMRDLLGRVNPIHISEDINTRGGGGVDTQASLVLEEMSTILTVVHTGVPWMHTTERGT